MAFRPIGTAIAARTIPARLFVFDYLAFLFHRFRIPTRIGFSALSSQTNCPHRALSNKCRNLLLPPFGLKLTRTEYVLSPRQYLCSVRHFDYSPLISSSGLYRSLKHNGIYSVETYTFCGRRIFRRAIQGRPKLRELCKWLGYQS